MGKKRKPAKEDVDIDDEDDWDTDVDDGEYIPDDDDLTPASAQERQRDWRDLERSREDRDLRRQLEDDLWSDD